MTTPPQHAATRPRVQNWIERLTIWRAVRTIAAVVVVLVLTGALLVRLFEPKTFDDFGLAVWWAVTTVTTVGYGDIVPVTSIGRIIGGVLMIVGVSMIPLVTSIVVSILAAKRSSALDAEQQERLARIEERLERLGR